MNDQQLLDFFVGKVHGPLTKCQVEEVHKLGLEDDRCMCGLIRKMMAHKMGHTNNWG